MTLDSVLKWDIAIEGLNRAIDDMDPADFELDDEAIEAAHDVLDIVRRDRVEQGRA